MKTSSCERKKMETRTWKFLIFFLFFLFFCRVFSLKCYMGKGMAPACQFLASNDAALRETCDLMFCNDTCLRAVEDVEDALIGKEKVVSLWCNTIESFFDKLKRREDHGSIKGTFVFCDDFDGCNTGSNNCISVFTLICIISSGLWLERRFAGNE